jgi:hypothetical protein
MRRLALLLVALAPIACGASRMGTDADWTADPPPKDRPFRVAEALNGPLPLDANEAKQQGLVGVRHDLMLAKVAHEPRCSCLAVEVGPPKDSRFFWMGSPPAVSGDTVTIAIGAQGVACPNGDPDERRRRPSISAVDRESEDVIVEIEDLPEGRPLASGAIIPVPGPRGSIYVRPRGAGVIYGRSPGAGRCKVK